jgi:Fe2+ or Zn2+ uptake regulation protein
MPTNFRERFHQFLADRGQTLTPQRAAIVDVVLAMRADFSAEDLQERMRLLHADNVSRATLFRTLDHLIEAGLLERFATGEEPTFRAVF